MPRDGSNIYHQPFPNVVDGTTIESAVYNGYTADITQDLNAPRPIVAGGTGATTAAGALAALGGETAFQQVTNYDSYAFKSGSFYSDTAATGAPVAGHWFYGTAIGSAGGAAIQLEARDILGTPPLKYTRFFNGTVWGAWQLSTAADGAVAKTGDTMTGDLNITKAEPRLNLNKTAALQNAAVAGTLNGSQRWILSLADASTESGGNAGSNFAIYRYTDAGAFIDSPFGIIRATGAATFGKDIFTGLDVHIGSGAGGTCYLGNSGARYLTYDGSRYLFNGANVWVSNAEIIGYNAGNQFRARGNSYSAMIRNDDTSTYILLTNGSDPDGGFNSLRPFQITNSNGNVNLGHAVNVAGQFRTNSNALADGSVYTGYANAQSGTYYFGNTAAKYLTCNGTDFGFSTGGLTVNGFETINGQLTISLPGTPSGHLKLFDTATGSAKNIRCNNNTLEFVNNAFSAVVATIDDNGGFGSNNGVYGRPGQTPIVLTASSFVQGSTGYICRNGVSIGGYGGNVFNMLWTSAMNLFVDNTLLGPIAIACDYRIKKDVIDLPGMWDTVKKLRPIQYQHTNFSPPSHLEHVKALKDRKAKLKQDDLDDDINLPGEHLFVDDGVERWGFAAHHLQEVLTPSAAHGAKDAPNQIQSPNPMTVIAALTKALQEAMARIEALEAR